MYIFGGFNMIEHVQMLFPEVWRYEFSSGHSERLSTSGPSPTTVASQSMLLSNNKLYLFGGSGIPFGMHVSNDLHVLDLDSLQWELLPCHGEPPSVRFGQVVQILLYPLQSVPNFTLSTEYGAETRQLHLDILRDIWARVLQRCIHTQPDHLDLEKN